MSEPRRFRLLGYYVVASLLTIVAVSAAFAWTFAREIEDDLVGLAHEDAVRIALHLHHRVVTGFIEPTVRDEAWIDLAEPDQLSALDAVVDDATTHLGIVRIYFFDPGGSIVYSTVHQHMGFSISADDNPSYAGARSGTASSTLKQREDPLDLTGETGDLFLLETYVPVDSLAAEPGAPEPDGPRWVIETYQDATPIIEESTRARRRLIGIAAGAMICLFLILLVVVARADRRLGEGDADLRRVNRRLVDLTETLEEEVERRTVQLVEREKLASLGTLAAGVAHELNNPLATISACAEGLERKVFAAGPRDEEGIRRYLGFITDETYRCKDITGHLLDFSRQDPVPRDEDVDLDELLAGTMTLLRLQQKNHPATIEVDLASDLGKVRGDPSALRQVLFNLTENGLDATGDGGTVAWSGRREGGQAVLVCRDTGVGIAPENLPRIWDPFYTDKPAGQGTGLGLSLAFSIIRRHGGEISIESAGAGCGTTAILRLPLVEDGRR